MTDRHVKKREAPKAKSNTKVKPKDLMHEALPVHGYVAQSDSNVELVNFHKQWEERALRHLDWLGRQPGIDSRWLAIGRTQLEKAFMAVNRAVFKPLRIALPEDRDPERLEANQRPPN